MGGGREREKGKREGGVGSEFVSKGDEYNMILLVFTSIASGTRATRRYPQ